MEHASRIPFGRQDAAVPSPRTDTTADKWRLLDRLTVAADRFGLNNRTLAVLRGLLSFLPDRRIPPCPVEATVYPANRTLCERLHGMPESTLRRHLARLVAAGLIRRRDSANRKRFARRIGGDLRIAFGLDLSPLAERGTEIAAAAECAERDVAEAQALRDEVRALRSVSTHPLPEDNAALDRVLRRRLTIEALSAIRDALAAADVDAAAAAPILGGTSGGNERHIQRTDESESILPGSPEESERRTPLPPAKAVMNACPGVVSLFGRAEGWDAVGAIADRGGPMIGIDGASYRHATTSMGRARAAAVVLCLIERAASIRSPAAYLRGLARRWEQGAFDLSRFLTQGSVAPRRTIVS